MKRGRSRTKKSKRRTASESPSPSPIPVRTRKESEGHSPQPQSRTNSFYHNEPSRTGINRPNNHNNHNNYHATAVPALEGDGSRSSSTSSASPHQRRSTALVHTVVEEVDEDRRRLQRLPLDKDRPHAVLRQRASAQKKSPTRTTVKDLRRPSSRKEEDPFGMVGTPFTRTPVPTPRPPPGRRLTVLTSTPAFIREERLRQHRHEGGSPAPTLTRRALELVTPARSTLARGFSHLRDSVSHVLARRDVSPGGGVWGEQTPGVSAIKRVSRRPSVSTASLPSDIFGRRTEASRDDLRFLRSSHSSSSDDDDSDAHAGDENGHRGTAARPPSAGGGGGSRGGPPRISSLSESLGDLVSSSHSSRHGSRSLRTSQQGRSESHLAEPDVSAIAHQDAALRSYVLTRSEAPPRPPLVPNGLTSSSSSSRAHQRRQTMEEEREPNVAPRAERLPFYPPLPSKAPHGDRPDKKSKHLKRPQGERAAEPPPSEQGRPGSPWDGTEDRARDALLVGLEEPAPLYLPLLPEPLYAFLGRVSRAVTALCILSIMVLFMASAVMVLLNHRLGWEDALLRLYVNTVPELHALYRVPSASLPAAGVRQLYYRTLSEGIERLERSTLHRRPGEDSTHRERVTYFTQMIRAYVALEHNCRLYARSRDESRWRRHVHYALGDAWRYGIGRPRAQRSWAVTLTRPSPGDLASRAWSTVACYTQQELLPCPSLAQLQRERARAVADAGDGYEDVNAAYESPARRQSRLRRRAQLKADWESEVYLETLLDFVRELTRQGTRDYNRM